MLLPLALLLAFDPSDLRYYECRISVGQVFSCTATGFTGQAVALGNGNLYRTCELAGGRVVTCGHAFTGTTVIEREDKFRECDLAAGRVASCKATGFNGEAVLMGR